MCCQRCTLPACFMDELLTKHSPIRGEATVVHEANNCM